MVSSIFEVYFFDNREVCRIFAKFVELCEEHVEIQINLAYDF